MRSPTRSHTDSLRASLLAIMDAKHHPAWGAFARGEVPLDRLEHHFQQEWEVYVRDFPVLLARVLGHAPPDEVRRALAANIFEEQTGGISQSEAHPELFLRMMEGCGYDRHRFDKVTLGPAAQRYRAHLDACTADRRWVVGAAVMTIFVEGSVNHRRELDEGAPKPLGPDEIEAQVAAHPLVKVHGVSPAAMELVRVHRRVESGHRHDAWAGVLDHCSQSEVTLVLDAMREAHRRWMAYRDEVARACGVKW